MARYDLELGPAVNTLLDAHPPHASLICYRIPSTSQYGDIARTAEGQVFSAFFGNDSSYLAEAYAAYEAFSTFLLLVDCDAQRVVGSLRIIEHSDSGLKTLNDIRGEPLFIPTDLVTVHHGINDLYGCWDVATLVALKPYRGNTHLVGTTLYGLFYLECLRAGIDHVVTVMDGHIFEQLVGWLGVPFEPIAGSSPFSYMGSQSSRAAYCDVSKVHEAVTKYMERLSPDTRAMAQLYADRLIHGEDLPKIITVI